jgi:uncharacterized protein DUF1569
MNTLADERCRTEIIQRLRTLRPDAPRQWGKMSAHQMVCHLCDSFKIATGEMVASPASGFAQRTIIKWIALYAPLRWPPGIPTRPEVDQEVGGTKPAQFAADVAALEAIVMRIATNSQTFAGLSHPIFGPMSARGWLRWGYLHMDHHLRQFGQ